MAPSENEYQEYFLGVKAAGAWCWQPHYLHEPNVMKSGSLSLLEPSGPNRACYGTPMLRWRLCNRSILNCRWKYYFPPKRRFSPLRLQSFITQMTQVGKMGSLQQTVLTWLWICSRKQRYKYEGILLIAIWVRSPQKLLKTRKLPRSPVFRTCFLLHLIK